VRDQASTAKEVGCPETSVSVYRYSLRDNPEVRSSQRYPTSLLPFSAFCVCVCVCIYIYYFIRTQIRAHYIANELFSDVFLPFFP